MQSPFWLGGLRAAVGALALIATLAACDRPPAPSAPATAAAAPAAESDLGWAIAGDWRTDPARDVWRHPAETLQFFGLAPGQTVVEVFPGRGWYTDILGPYLTRTQGVLYAATLAAAGPDDPAAALQQQFRERLIQRPELYGAVEITEFGPNALAPCPPGAADLVLVFRNVHTFMAGGYAEEAFKAFYESLKPGGVLGVVQHRARSTGLQDPSAGDGYVQEEYVKTLAREAGFEFLEASEINANPKDAKDHPFGVWTLPPVSRTAPLGEPGNPDFVRKPFDDIGESDRMTLKFRKPAAPPPA